MGEPHGDQREQRVLEGLEHWELETKDLTQGRKLGQGAFAAVFSGTWREKPVALKMMDRDRSEMPKKMQQDLCRELAILMSVNHPNVVRLYGVVPYQPVWIVMELCAGRTCFELLHEAASVPLSWSQCSKICLDVAQAMAYLHNFDPQ